MSKSILLSLAFLVSATAQATTKKYNTHFVNPIVDKRIEFTNCAVDGALFGILTGELGDVLCWGREAGKVTKKARQIYAYKAAGRKTFDYYVLVKEKYVRGSGDEAGGYREWKTELQLLNRGNLSESEPTQVSTLTISEYWEYESGSIVIKGRLPGSNVKFEAPFYSLSTIDEELDQFAAELGDGK